MDRSNRTRECTQTGPELTESGVCAGVRECIYAHTHALKGIHQFYSRVDLILVQTHIYISFPCQLQSLIPRLQLFFVIP